MAFILIDGYNLIGILHKNLEMARNEIINKLSDYSKIKGHNITVIFDGWKEGKSEETTIFSGGVRVIYSRVGERADSVIMRIISKEKRPWIVISSDKEIVDFAIRNNLIPIRADEFEERLYIALHGNESEDDEYYVEDDISSPQRKGAPKKMSKFQRKKLQALKKL